MKNTFWPALLLATSASATAIDNSPNILTKAEQAAIVAEAKHQQAATAEIEAIYRAGGTRAEVQQPLLELSRRWTSLAGTDLEKSALMSCSVAASNLQGLDFNRRSTQMSVAFDVKREKFFREDKEQCQRALGNPREAFLKLRELYPDLQVE